MKSTIIPAMGYVTFCISAQTDQLDSVESDIAHHALIERLTQLATDEDVAAIYKLRGQYKGIPERSVAITVRANATMFEILRSIGTTYCQESILAIGYRGTGALMFTDGSDRIVSIGHCTSIESTNGHEAWSEVVATGETFTFA